MGGGGGGLGCIHISVYLLINVEKKGDKFKNLSIANVEGDQICLMSFPLKSKDAFSLHSS